MVLAHDVVKLHLLGVLPQGVPPSFQAILSAKFAGTGRKRTATARLVMFDGAHAVVEVFSWGTHDGNVCGGHRWLEWDGPPCFFENGVWQRDPEWPQ